MGGGGRQTDRQTDRETDRHRDDKTKQDENILLSGFRPITTRVNIQAILLLLSPCVLIREREREADRQTDRQTDRDRNRDRDRQTDRKRFRHGLKTWCPRCQTQQRCGTFTDYKCRWRAKSWLIESCLSLMRLYCAMHP